MKTLERQRGVIISWIHSEIIDGRYNIIHTRTEHMSADMFTKTFTDVGLWSRLRTLINVYSPEQLANLELNPSNEWLSEKLLWQIGGKASIPAPEQTRDEYLKYHSSFNKQYFHIIEGASTADSDWRKPAKLKRPRAKAVLKPSPKPTPQGLSRQPAGGSAPLQLSLIHI